MSDCDFNRSAILTSSETDFWSFSTSSASRFLLSDRASPFGRPEDLDIRPTAAEAIFLEDVALKSRIFYLEPGLKWLLADDRPPFAASVQEKYPSHLDKDF